MKREYPMVAPFKMDDHKLCRAFILPNGVHNKSTTSASFADMFSQLAMFAWFAQCVLGMRPVDNDVKHMV